MAIRCRHVGVIAGVALALSVAAASDWSVGAPSAPAEVSAPLIPASATEASPVPAPVLFLAGGLLALVAMVRRRQKLGAWFGS